MQRLNLGCGKDVREGWVNVDRFPHPGVFVATAESLPFEDGMFEEVLASHVLEHVLDFAAAWREIHRVLAIGGVLDVQVPYGWNADPFHLRFFTEGSLYWLLLPFEHGNLDRDSWFDLIDWETRKPYLWELHFRLRKVR